MKEYESKFSYGQRIVKYLLFVSIALSLAAVLLTQKGSVEQSILLLSALAVIAALLAVICKYCRCPHCGRRIFLGVLAVKSCPRCRRNLITGKKVKK